MYVNIYHTWMVYHDLHDDGFLWDTYNTYRSYDDLRRISLGMLTIWGMEHGWRGTSGWGFLRGVQKIMAQGFGWWRTGCFSKNGPQVVGCLGLFFWGGMNLLLSYGGDYELYTINHYKDTCFFFGEWEGGQLQHWNLPNRGRREWFGGRAGAQR